MKQTINNERNAAIKELDSVEAQIAKLEDAADRETDRANKLVAKAEDAANKIAGNATAIYDKQRAPLERRAKFLRAEITSLL